MALNRRVPWTFLPKAPRVSVLLRERLPLLVYFHLPSTGKNEQLSRHSTNREKKIQQSINQSIKGSINQSINGSSINQSKDRSIDWSIVHQSINQSKTLTYLIVPLWMFLFLTPMVSALLIHVGDKTRNPRNKALHFTARKKIQHKTREEKSSERDETHARTHHHQTPPKMTSTKTVFAVKQTYPGFTRIGSISKRLWAFSVLSRVPSS